jgi:DNA-binding NtrC family response regulator
MASVVKPGKVMLVCSGARNEVEECLLAAGCRVIKVKDGETAIARVEREIFDAAVLVATGKRMDLAETVFNLRDINRSMQIIIMGDEGGIDQGAIARQIARYFVPNTTVLPLEKLESLFEPQKLGKKR